MNTHWRLVKKIQKASPIIVETRWQPKIGYICSITNVTKARKCTNLTEQLLFNQIIRFSVKSLEKK